MSDFHVIDGEVWMVGNHKPCRLSDGQCDRLLDLFEDAEAADLFNRLYAACQKAQGELFIPRVTSMRWGLSLVVDNEAPNPVRAMFAASVAMIQPQEPGAA